MFANRVEAGVRLAEKLARYHAATGAVVLGIPRGGVVVAAGVAQRLGLPLDIVAAAKVSDPANPEYAVGAVAPDGVVLVNPRTGLSAQQVAGLSGPALDKVAREIALFREDRPALDVRGRTAILIDDGIATGLTAMAAADWLVRQGAAKVLVGTPVAAKDSVAAMSAHAAEVVVVEVPEWFSAVGQFYSDFTQTSDSEVLDLLRG